MKQLIDSQLKPSSSRFFKTGLRSGPRPLPPCDARTSIPGDDAAFPLLASAVNTVKVLLDMYGFIHAQHERHGELFRINVFSQKIVAAVGPDANQFVLQNREQVFSNRLGYEPFLRHLFPGGLMLRDFDEHRQHRTIMQNAFRRSCMEGYLRKTVKETSFKGFEIPADTLVFIGPSYTHRMRAWWSNPDDFDPGRFSPERAEHKQHPFQWIPFSGGAHTCMGMQFAYLQAKAIVFYMLNRFRFRFAPGYRPRYKQIPLPKPSDGLRLVLEPL